MTSLLSGIRRRTPFILLFLVFLGFFLWNGAWHITSRLVMTGQTDGAVDAVVQWDSGNGFNDYESAGFVCGHPVSPGEKPAVVKIIRTGKRQPSSGGGNEPVMKTGWLTYFLFVSLYFLIPVIALDVQCLWRRFRVREREGQKGRWLACRRSA